MRAIPPATGTPSLIPAMYRRQAKPIVAGYLFRILHQICEALVPVAFGLVIGRAVTTGDVGEMVLGAVGILVLFAVLAAGGGYGYYFTGKAALTEAHRLRIAVVHRVLKDPSATSGRQAGELLSITSSDTRAATEVISVIGSLVAAIMGLGVATAILIGIDPGLGLGLLAAVIVLVTLTQLLGPYLEHRLSARQQAVGLAAAVAADLFAGLRSLRGFGGVAEGVRRYRTASRTSLRATVAATGSSAIVTGVSAVATGVLVVLTAVVASQYAVTGVISVADLVTVIGMASFLMDPLSHITNSVRDLAITRASGKRVADLLGSPGPETSAEHGEGPSGISPPDHAAILELLDLADPSFTPINLRSESALLGVVAIDVATADRLASLLGGETSPDSGRLMLNETELSSLSDDARQRAVLSEPHAVHLLGGTLAAALDTGGTGLGTVDLPTALAAAAVRLEDLAGHAAGSGPAGIDLLDQGANLSGGQRQRVALARALHADRQVLVLRDPTSAVDPVTEDEIAAGVSELRQNRHTIVVTNSPLWLRRCDQVLFIDGDGVTTVAEHSALLDLPSYREAVLR